MYKVRIFFGVFAVFFTGALFAAPAGVLFYNIRDYGATGDGVTLETAAFARAIDAASVAGGGTVYAPPGHYHTGTIKLKSHITLYIEAGAVILGSETPDDYPPTENVWRDGDRMVRWLRSSTPRTQRTLPLPDAEQLMVGAKSGGGALSMPILRNTNSVLSPRINRPNSQRFLAADRR